MPLYQGIPAGFIYGMGFGAFVLSLSTVVAEQTTADTRGKVFGFFFAAFDVGFSVAGFTLGFWAAAYGLHSMFLLLVPLLVLAPLLYMTAMEPTLRASLVAAVARPMPPLPEQPVVAVGAQGHLRQVTEQAALPPAQAPRTADCASSTE